MSTYEPGFQICIFFWYYFVLIKLAISSQRVNAICVKNKDYRRYRKGSISHAVCIFIEYNNASWPVTRFEASITECDNWTPLLTIHVNPLILKEYLQKLSSATLLLLKIN